MLNPGVGTLTLTAPPRPNRVCAESVLVAPACAAFTCKLMETGMRLPPITRNAAWPPKDVRLSLAPFCFHDAMPAVSVMFANPSEPRAPNAVPLPRSALGMARSPLIVMPVPPLGLLQFGIPNDCAASGATANAVAAKLASMRFIDILQRENIVVSPVDLSG